MKKTFDAVQWMRKRRAQIDQEHHALNWDQQRRKTRQIIMEDPLLKSIGANAVAPESLHPLATRAP